MKNTKETGFHQQHENLTKRLYNEGGMLPGRFVLVLTTRCNLSCPFCPQVKRAATERMTPEEWLRVIDQMPDYARVTLTGGEPLLFKGFMDVARAVGRRFNFNVISNGTLLSEKIIDRLLGIESFQVLSISIDTIGNVNRAFRSVQWERLLEMMRYFRRRRDEVGSSALLDVKSIVLDENAGELLDLHKLLMEDVGCDTQAYQFIKGSPLQHADVMFPFEATHETSHADVYQRFDTICEFLDKVRKYSVANGSKVFLHPKFASLQSEEPLPDLSVVGNSELHDPVLFAPCRFPWASAHINDTGDLFPCQAIRMGNVKDQTLEEIFRGEPMQMFRQTLKREGTTQACNRCGWLRLVDEG